MKLIRAWHLAVGETEAWRGYALTLGSCCRAEIFILTLLGHLASILKIVEGGERWSGWGVFLVWVGFFCLWRSQAGSQIPGSSPALPAGWRWESQQGLDGQCGGGPAAWGSSPGAGASPARS